MKIAKIKGKEYKARGELKFTTKTPTKVAFTSDWSAGALNASAKGLYDYDGMMRYDLTLNKCPVKVDSLKIQVPLNPAVVYLMHACPDLIRSNYGGLIPKGNGVVWKSSDAVRRQIQTSFVPYLWVGAETSGFSMLSSFHCCRISLSCFLSICLLEYPWCYLTLTCDWRFASCGEFIAPIT